VTGTGRRFGDRLARAFAASGQACVGIDPHAHVLREWGLPDSPAGAREFGLRMVAAATGVAGVVKPQIAFFERHGSAGYAALERVLAEARSAGLLVLADVKRVDIGSTIDAYAAAWLTPGSPLEADAITVAPYHGFGSLDGVIELAHAHGKGVFVVTATSNPEAASLQQAVVADGPDAGATVAGLSVRGAARHAAGAELLGDVGVVIGATVRMAAFGIDPADLAGVPILAPGFGHQGARASELDALYGAARGNVLVSASRSLTARGADGARDAIRELADESRKVAR
jgi:orotidine-5'-phosphate decarboxylase